MLSGLFKPAWQSSSVYKRMQAIEKMDALDEANQDILADLAKNDHERSVRLAALNKLRQVESVFLIRQTHSDDATRAQADLVFNELIGHKSQLSEKECRDIMAKHPESSGLFAKVCPHATLRSEVLLSLAESEQAVMIANVEYSDTRLLIAEQLSSPEHLELARKLLKGKDKTAEKIIKTKIDDQHAKERQDKENLETAERLCDNMEYLANHDEWRPEFMDQYLVTSKRWDSLNFVPNEYLNQSYQKAHAKVNSGIQQRKRIETTHAEQEKLSKDLKAYCEKIASYSRQELTDKQSQHQDTIKKSQQQWQLLSEITQSKAEIKKHFDLAQAALESIVQFSAALDPTLTHEPEVDLESKISSLKSSLSQLQWPSNYPVLNAKTEISTELNDLQTKLSNEQKEAGAKLDDLHKRINRLLGNTKRGELNRAKRELSAVIKAAADYSGKDKIALDERLEKATLAVDKMSDWKDFATEPKYIELCDAMEALTSSKKHPDALSVEIKKLQDKWKALGHSESADLHWERFKKAGDKAYEPCSEFFKQRHDKRRKNLEKREPYLSQLRDMLEKTDWSTTDADFKPIEVKLRTISNDWKKIKDVEQGPGQKQWKKFSKLRNEVYEKLDVIYDSNIKIKNGLITQALSLLEADVKEDSLKKLQTLQKQWKDIGITRRKQDQAAWKKFKSATDNIYEKIQGVRKAKRAEEDEHLNGYRNISKEILKLAKKATDLADADSNFERLRADYKALPPLPHGLPEKLVAAVALDYKKACDAFNKGREQIIKKDKSKALDNLAKKAALCTELEALGANASQEATEALQATIAGLEITDNELRKRFETRLAAARDTDRAHASEVRQLLCIDLEILLGVDSPPEDKALRMKIQLERMQKGGFGQERHDKDAMIKKLKLDWYCLPGGSPEIQNRLDERFSKLIKT